MNHLAQIQSEFLKVSLSGLEGVKILDMTEPFESVDKRELHGFVTNIERDTTENDDFRRVLYTGKHSQLVLMSLKPNEEIGEEVHDLDQFFRIDQGSGRVIINGREYDISDGSAFIVPEGVKHNVIAGADGLKLYSIYSPPQHADKTVHKTKEDAEKSDEHFDGKMTE